MIYNFLFASIALLAGQGDVVQTISVQDHEPIIVKIDVPPNTENVKSVIKWQSRNPKLLWRQPKNSDGTEIYAWAPPGSYELDAWIITVTVDFTAMKHDIAINDQQFIIEVVGVVPPVVPPGPNPPGPQPPGPIISTDFRKLVLAAYTALPSTVKSRLVETVHGDGHKTTKAAKLIIAENHQQVADAASIGNNYDPATMMAELKTRHSSTLDVQTLTLWSPFFKGVAQALVIEKIPSNDTATHVLRFKDIADILTKSE